MPFSPGDLLPIAWYDPSDLSTLFQLSDGTVPVATNSDPVGSIADKSGNGNHLATAGSRPLYKTSGGFSWLEFDGTDDAIAGTFAAPVAQPFDRLAAFRLIAAAPTDWLIGAADDFCIMGNTGSDLAMYANGGFTTYTPAPAAGTDFVATMRYNGGSSQLSVDTEAYQGANGGGASSSSLSIAKTNGTGDFVNLRFYGLIQFDRVLTDIEIDQLRNYLAGKAGLPWFVPEPAVILVPEGPSSGGRKPVRRTQLPEWWLSYTEQQEIELAEREKEYRKQKAIADALTAERRRKEALQLIRARRAQEELDAAEEAKRQRVIDAQLQADLQALREAREAKETEATAQVQAALDRAKVKRDQEAFEVEVREERKQRIRAINPRNSFTDRFEAITGLLRKKGWKAK